MASSDLYLDAVRLQMAQPVTIDSGVVVQGSGWVGDGSNNDGPAVVINKGTD